MQTLIVALVAIVSYSCSQATPLEKCVQGVNCRVPDCFCPTFTHPLLPVADIPQMVYFAFDDALTSQVNQHYLQLFNSNRLNPNGCPITMSLFVQHNWTSYALVSSQFQRGNEIGSHSINHNNVDDRAEMVAEAGGQKRNLVTLGHVPADQVLGWRSPNLKPAGDAQPEVLEQFNYTYDISLSYTRKSASDNIPWPYTLDYGNPYPCSVPPCPSSNVSRPGFWEIPINSLYNLQTGYPCAYVDACVPQGGVQEAFEYLKTNFERAYKSNRAPFGLNMHGAWFYRPHFLQATHRFLDYLQQLPDVYVLSASRVLQWMRNPVKVSEVAKLPGWGCGSPEKRTTTTTSPTTTAAPTTTTTTKSSAVTSPAPPQVCMQGVNCHLPSCQCSSLKPPAGLLPAKTPQMIVLTFIDGVDHQGDTYLQQLLKLTNPNGCPISATFFVPHKHNGPNRYEQGLRNEGHEIAMYGRDSGVVEPEKVPTVTHVNNAANVSPRAGAINQGYRGSSNLPRDDSLFKALNASGLLYDSSLSISRPMTLNADLPWPYTLDFGAEKCTACPKDRYPGLWEVPITPLLDYQLTLDPRFVCRYADACFYRPMTKDQTSQLFHQNLAASLNTNRAPMGINLRKYWFSHSAYAANRAGLMTFLRDVLKRGDVYVLSVEKMLQWMRNPTAVDSLTSLSAWQC